MTRRIITTGITFLLLIVMIICVITGFLKLPGLLSILGLSSRQVPLVLITDLHIWSGLCMVVLSIAHIFTFKDMMKRMIRSIYSN